MDTEIPGHNAVAPGTLKRDVRPFAPGTAGGVGRLAAGLAAGWLGTGQLSADWRRGGARWRPGRGGGGGRGAGGGGRGGVGGGGPGRRSGAGGPFHDLAGPCTSTRE